MGKTKSLLEEPESQVPVLRKKSIYHIEAEYIDLMNRIEDVDGELSEETSKQLDITKDELEVKASSYGYLIKQFESDALQLDTEIKRLTAMKKQKETLQTTLKERISQAMQMFGIEEINKNNLRLFFRPSKQLIVLEGAKVPKSFLKVDLTPVLDKRGLKEYIESGKKVKGVSIKEIKNLQLK